MVEILLRVTDKKGDNPTKVIEVRRMHRGDVVSWMPDGHAWSPRELTNPDWRIIRFTTMTISEATALASSETDAANTKLNLWKRIRKLDLDSLLIGPGKFKTFLFDDTRAEPILMFKDNLKLIDDITVLKPNADSLVS